MHNGGSESLQRDLIQKKGFDTKYDSRVMKRSNQRKKKMLFEKPFLCFKY